RKPSCVGKAGRLSNYERSLARGLMGKCFEFLMAVAGDWAAAYFLSDLACASEALEKSSIIFSFGVSA
ncbi:MAG: hypothetical protein ACK53L_23840, partial [Pirellulaceae bacterium]